MTSLTRLIAATDDEALKYAEELAAKGGSSLEFAVADAPGMTDLAFVCLGELVLAAVDEEDEDPSLIELADEQVFRFPNRVTSELAEYEGGTEALDDLAAEWADMDGMAPYADGCEELLAQVVELAAAAVDDDLRLYLIVS